MGPTPDHDRSPRWRRRACRGTRRKVSHGVAEPAHHQATSWVGRREHRCLKADQVANPRFLVSSGLKENSRERQRILAVLLDAGRNKGACEGKKERSESVTADRLPRQRQELLHFAPPLVHERRGEVADLRHEPRNVGVRRTKPISQTYRISEVVPPKSVVREQASQELLVLG
jgi:hypothetical protein